MSRPGREEIEMLGAGALISSSVFSRSRRWQETVSAAQRPWLAVRIIAFVRPANDGHRWLPCRRRARRLIRQRKNRGRRARKVVVDSEDSTQMSERGETGRGRGHFMKEHPHASGPPARWASSFRSLLMCMQLSEITLRLAENAEAVCRHYLSNGRRRGRYWVVGDVRNTPGRHVCSPDGTGG